MDMIGRKPRRGRSEPHLHVAAVRAAGDLLAILGWGERE